MTAHSDKETLSVAVAQPVLVTADDGVLVQGEVRIEPEHNGKAVVTDGKGIRNGEARKAIQAGGLYIGNDKVTDEDYRITEDMLKGDGLLIRRGKKAYHLLVLKK